MASNLPVANLVALTGKAHTIIVQSLHGPIVYFFHQPLGFITPIILEKSSSKIMQILYLVLAIFLLLNLCAGIWRVLRGPTVADRMLAVQLFGTAAVAILLLFAQAFDNPALRDVALVFALLSAVTAVAFVRRVWPEKKEFERDSE